MSTQNLLEVDELSAAYGRARALWSVALTVGAGEGVGIVGRNGAGKSTLLRSIAGVHRNVSGSIRLNGQTLVGRSPHLVARRGVSLVREGAPVFTELSVANNIALGGSLAQRRGRRPMPIEDVWTAFPDLEPIAGRTAGVLSGGQRQMLALATALMSQPTILLLDEPSGGLAPAAAASAFDAIGRLRSAGLAVLIAEQNRDWLDRVADHTIEIESGRVQPATGRLAGVAYRGDGQPA